MAENSKNPDPETWRRIQSVFQQAMGREPSERAAFVAQSCHDDAALMGEVQSLLEAYDEAEDELEVAPITAMTGSVQDHADLAGTLPGYDVLAEIHRGGQGIVYEAIQLSTKRKVAVKVMIAGPLAATANKRRFQREVELAGSLRHPGIVPIFDSGLAQGQYFYAMELIDGDRLDEYVRRQALSKQETLRLFCRICDAIEYAHQNGVIHRDLKPSNILVDREGQPHVLDFGLAKLGGVDPEETVALSMTGQVMGTLAYMSPEQAEGQSAEIDARTDVYSLGVLLYELLTGELPYPLDSSLAENLSTIRHSDPNRVSLRESRVDNEVSTIVLKALGKEKERRYQSAGRLGEDIAKYLRGDPIDAKRDSALYVLRKNVRRYVVHLAILMSLMVGIAIGVFALDGMRTPRDLSPPLRPLEPGEFYSQLDLENQIDTIRDMVRRDFESRRILKEFKSRFQPLRESDFVSSMSDQRKADFRKMKELAVFLADDPSPEAIQQYIDRPQPKPPDPGGNTSGLANETAAQVLQQALMPE